MKNYLTLLMIWAMFFQSENSLAQTNGLKVDTAITHYNYLIASKNPADRTLLKQELYQLLASDNEKDWVTAHLFFSMIKTSTADSILSAEEMKFPTGLAVRDKQAKVIYDETDALKKEELYQKWIKDFPPEKSSMDRNQYDYVRTAISVAFAKADNVQKALQYAGMIEADWYKGSSYAATADELLKHDHSIDALVLYKKARNNAYKYLTTNRQDRYASNASWGFASYGYSIAEILYKQKKYEEALTYAKQARDSSKYEIGNQNPYYIKTLMALGKNQEAFDEIEAAIKQGKATVEMREAIQTLYGKVKGSMAGYDQYMASVNKILADKKRAEIAKSMINLPAPNFTLKDVDGNTVSLASLKGKIVVVDFWAIWCVPCKASMPAMLLAINKYKDDPDVKFLFIHTWENHHRNQKFDDSPTITAKKYVDDSHYPFRVLMDLKDPVTGKNNVVTSYKVTAIPTKFVIDKMGNIRFRLTALTDGDDAGAEEVSAMIDLTKGAK
ncbi:redoxin domain-containing protein [Mucilaginibacter paludis]|uniref:Alkyl hydroperoxide reductase/ Thiol specific antioxidant/ Mal allergen n=1 Tax=Mucilaginibacter paludis DSM 18603 TaxID=714943 RepID=H1YA48_9SPHI|nr:redoxin domain-containing protein [Mucilaginibacter paludis]EHQ25929.1 alkyl hydroperoxide reductase/ Thiol specific antioxidant/ Mal allergen [Mucilaginibacter paludis DSM 18603]